MKGRATSVDVSSFDPTVGILESGSRRGVFFGISAKGAMVKPLFGNGVEKQTSEVPSLLSLFFGDPRSFRASKSRSKFRYFL